MRKIAQIFVPSSQKSWTLKTVYLRTPETNLSFDHRILILILELRSELQPNVSPYLTKLKDNFATWVWEVFVALVLSFLRFLCMSMRNMQKISFLNDFCQFSSFCLAANLLTQFNLFCLFRPPLTLHKNAKNSKQ